MAPRARVGIAVVAGASVAVLVATTVAVSGPAGAVTRRGVTVVGGGLGDVAPTRPVDEVAVAQLVINGGDRFVVEGGDGLVHTVIGGRLAGGSRLSAFSLSIDQALGVIDHRRNYLSLGGAHAMDLRSIGQDIPDDRAVALKTDAEVNEAALGPDATLWYLATGRSDGTPGATLYRADATGDSFGQPNRVEGSDLMTAGGQRLALAGATLVAAFGAAWHDEPKRR